MNYIGNNTAYGISPYVIQAFQAISLEDNLRLRKIRRNINMSDYEDGVYLDKNSSGILFGVSAMYDFTYQEEGWTKIITLGLKVEIDDIIYFNKTPYNNTQVNSGRIYTVGIQHDINALQFPIMYKKLKITLIGNCNLLELNYYSI